ncbi:MAG: ankyrin repeat domain-containing protein [Bacteroidetes bacterium]|nr:ankyrin repeat domain-containing protein [Bacteroidota bacterium]
MNVFWDAIGSDDIVEVIRLIDYGCDINGQDENGDTPLHHAIESAFEKGLKEYDNKGIGPFLDYSIIGILIQNGADANIKDNNGESVLDWVKRKMTDKELFEIKKIIEEAKR